MVTGIDTRVRGLHGMDGHGRVNGELKGIRGGMALDDHLMAPPLRPETQASSHTRAAKSASDRCFFSKFSVDRFFRFGYQP